MSLGREQGTNSEHHLEVSLKSGGRQGGYSINPEKSVVFFCVFVFEYTGGFHIISKFCKVFAFLKIIFFSNKGEISYFLTSSLTH